MKKHIEELLIYSVDDDKDEKLDVKDELREKGNWVIESGGRSLL